MIRLGFLALVLLAACTETSPFGPGCDITLVITTTEEAMDSLIAATHPDSLWVYPDSMAALVSNGCP